MKEGFEPKSFKNYNLTPAEQIELDKFLLKKGTSGHPNHQWLPCFSLFQERMANFDHVGTTSI
jgi:hypothetical protein